MQAPYRFIEQLGGRLRFPAGLLAKAAEEPTPAEDRLERRIAHLATEIDAAPPSQRFFRH